MFSLGPYTAAAAAQSVIIIVALSAAPLAVDLARAGRTCNLTVSS